MKNWNWVLICFILALVCQLFSLGGHLYHMGHEHGMEECKQEVQKEQEKFHAIIDSMLDADAEGKFQDEKIIILTQ